MNKAYKVAIEALKKQRHRYAFDANLFKLGMADYPHARKCAKEYDRLTEAIKALESPQQIKLDL